MVDRAGTWLKRVSKWACQLDDMLDCMVDHVLTRANKWLARVLNA